MAASRSRSPLRRAGVDGGLGAAGGKHIDNKHTVLDQVDRCLNQSSPPALEYLLCEHAVNPKSFGSTLARFGHAAVRYTLPSGEQVVINICGVAGQPMVHRITPSDYLFGTDHFDGACEQGGVYNRNFIGLRIERLPPGIIEALDSFYRAVEKSQNVGTSSFKLVGARMKNFLSRYSPLAEEQILLGNCAYWVSSGLEWCNLLQRRRLFPRAIFYDLLEKHHHNDPSNVHIVAYHWANHTAQAYPELYCASTGICSPLQLMRNWYYWRLQPFADCHVTIPEGSSRAIVTSSTKTPCRPGSWLRSFHSLCVLGIASLLIGTSTDFTVVLPSIHNIVGRAFLAIGFVVLQYWMY